MNALGKEVLKNVSRSFYLSMRVLPKAMREPVSLAYLLARASDTLADTVELPPALRSEMLADFSKILTSEDRSEWLGRLRDKVIPRQTHEGERVLLQSMSDVFVWLDALLEGGVSEPLQSGDHYQAPGSQSIGYQQHASILRVMKHILHGQQLDIERFELQSDFHFTLDAELEEYCYLVAGCVGEFWTEIGIISLGRFSRVDEARLKRWGANYGKGLQLINILRDLPGDLESGRCYLPGCHTDDQSDLLEQSKRWRTRARSYLADGMSYAESLVHRRTRMATALPGLIGERTLDLMDVADWEALATGLKVPRGEVYRCAWEALFV